MSERQVEIVRRCWEGLEEEPTNLWLEHYDPEVEIWNPPEFPVRGPFRGHAGVRQWATEIWEVVTGFHTEIEELIEAGDDEKVVSVVRTQGRMRHTELPVDFRWAAVWSFSGERIVRARGYLDPDEARVKAGLGK
jgi:ketosteroid isomerase-like protein